MLNGVIDIFAMIFGKMADLYKSFMVSDGISFWDCMIVVFLATGIISMLMRAFGASGISGGVSSTVAAYENAAHSKAIERKRAQELEHRQSYEYYESNRLRNESYAKRYNSDHS